MTQVLVQIDDDPPEVATVASVIEANAEDEDVAEALRSLRVGETVTFGGGGQPIVTITDLASAAPSCKPGGARRPGRRRLIDSRW
jgi:hypothetical protein